ncbi:hypothetical protein Baya_11432 [Bagarius yarrelli]|uniref:Uncharacterized protein n=1 Tax=Bagarius yarrelli TaxID=175774 RepID=A0A556V0P8_BAGYA|nr:hypothetical protein Baya_11432 [Bagarius yarrelli]
MLAAIIPHFRRGVSTPDLYNGVNAAVAEMTHTKETKEKEPTKRHSTLRGLICSKDHLNHPFRSRRILSPRADASVCPNDPTILKSNAGESLELKTHFGFQSRDESTHFSASTCLN